MARERISITRPLFGFHFALDPLVDGQTDAALTPVGTVKPLVPWGGSIVGISAVADEPAQAGAVSFDALINATQQSIDLALAVDATETYARYTAGTYRFAAGDQIGASYTSGTLTANAGVHVIVWVEFDGVGA